MEPVVGIFASRSQAEDAARRLRSGGFAPDHIQLVYPGSPKEFGDVPTDDAEESGVGAAVGGVVGGAVGAPAGLGLGAAAASLLLPGIGAVTAVGLAAAALLGAGGAVGGAAAGHALEEKTTSGLPHDELYLYEDALAQGRSIVFALPENAGETETARRALESAGAESLDAARERWWIGLRSAEKDHYEADRSDFEAVEPHYRRGYLAALHPDFRGKPFDRVREALRRRDGDAADGDAYRAGFERGRRHRRTSEALKDETPAGRPRK